MKNTSQREFYRLAYPNSYRPTLWIDVDQYEIEDVSEYGMKVKIDDDLAFMVDDKVAATIAFPGGREFDLSGQVVRLDEGYAGLQLKTPLPLNVIRSESLYIMTNFVKNN